MTSALVIGTGVAVAAFLVRTALLVKPRHVVPGISNHARKNQGRAGLVAWRRSRGGVGAMGKAFYKGGFEPRMNRREASLILSLK